MFVNDGAQMMKIGGELFPADMLGDLKAGWDRAHARLESGTASEKAKARGEIQKLTKAFAIKNALFLMMKHRPRKSIMSLGMEDDSIPVTMFPSSGDPTKDPRLMEKLAEIAIRLAQLQKTTVGQED